MPIFFVGWTPDNYLYPYVYHRGTFAQRICYNNSDVNQWYELQRVETNWSERQRLLSLIQETVAEDAPYIWVYQSTEFRTWGTWVHGDGLVYNPMHDLYFYHIYKTDSPQPAPYLDTLAPQISHPDDIEIDVGTIGQNVTWVATDQNRDTYEISKDGVIVDSGDWNSVYISASLDGLALGSYNFTLTVEDISNNTSADTVQVVVIPGGIDFGDPMVIIITIGSIGAVVVLIVLIIRVKR
ncbi:hypothetical protein E4H12_13125 [Candidatus Thorarchaeota archaeon]|nr:MAG: hypothetical protein E4H12_13125 [Candidatus Thorarchaeota archaeon]